VLEFEVYAILDEDVHKKSRNSYNRYPFFPSYYPKEGEKVHYRSVITYRPHSLISHVVRDGKIDTVNHSITRTSEIVVPSKIFDFCHKKVPYRNNILFDGERLKRNKYEERDFKNIDSLVKLHIVYTDKINFDPNTHYIHSIEIERYIYSKENRYQPAGRQVFRIVDKNDYSKHDCFKYYTIML
jgi:hypothetical protein